MTSLGDKRRDFSWKIGVLLQVAKAMGYEVALGRGYVSEAANEVEGGHPRSTHLFGLGQDIHLYRDEVYLSDGRGHDKLHDVWDMMGGAKRISGDLNHYSFEWQGVR